MIEVLEILPGDRAIVSTKGLRRVVVKATGEVVDELADEATARELVDFLGQPAWNDPAKAIGYEVLEEFLPTAEAQRVAALFNRCCKTATAAAEQYRPHE